MQLTKLSLVAAVVVGLSTSAMAADTLVDAFKNGKVNGELRAWYWDKTAEDTKKNNENITNFAIELGYVTDSFYGFRLGATFQGNATPWAEENAKTLYADEQAASGSVLSEAYIGYKLGKTDVKVGRQYINTPLVGGNYTRIFKESFQGVTITNTDLPQTTLFAGYANKFQGRTSGIRSTKIDDAGDAPKFEKRLVMGGGGTSPKSHAFDELFYLGATNKSIQNLTLTGQYALIKDVTIDGKTATDDIDLFYAEANYVLPLSGFKLGFDLNYRASKTGAELDKEYNFDGDMWAGRISISELYGFGASFAASTVSSNDSVIVSAGNGGDTYTGMLIRGPFMFTPLAGMDTYKLQADYDFSKVGVKGLKLIGQYVWADQDRPSENTPGTAKGTKADFKGYALAANYNVPFVKGLFTQLIWTSLEKEAFAANSNDGKKTDTDELWFKANYKF